MLFLLFRLLYRMSACTWRSSTLSSVLSLTSSLLIVCARKTGDHGTDHFPSNCCIGIVRLSLLMPSVYSTTQPYPSAFAPESGDCLTPPTSLHLSQAVRSRELLDGVLRLKTKNESRSRRKHTRFTSRESTSLTPESPAFTSSAYDVQPL